MYDLYTKRITSWRTSKIGTGIEKFETKKSPLAGASVGEVGGLLVAVAQSAG